VRFLCARRWKILERNVRTPVGELDIVARDGRTLVFIEVKTRRTAAFGAPQEAVGAAQAAADCARRAVVSGPGRKPVGIAAVRRDCRHARGGRGQDRASARRLWPGWRRVATDLSCLQTRLSGRSEPAVRPRGEGWSMEIHLSSYGYFRVAVVAPAHRVADVAFNTEQIRRAVHDADGCRFFLFPVTVPDGLYLWRSVFSAGAHRGSAPRR